jgi:hypothetical protein
MYSATGCTAQNAVSYAEKNFCEAKQWRYVRAAGFEPKALPSLPSNDIRLSGSNLCRTSYLIMADIKLARSFPEM